MPEHVPIPNYPFGIELEVIMPRGNSGESGREHLAEAITAAGVQCVTESYNHTVRGHWKIVTDQSLGYENAEVVSPILRGEDGLTQIRTVTKAIDEFGARVNRSCGMHVHIGVRGEPWDRVGTIKELVRTYNKFEPILDQLTAPSRRGPSGGGGYCGSVPFTPACHTATNLDELRRAYGNGQRSRKLNLEAYWRHGTVEFRHHQGTVNGEKAVNWVKLCLRMMAHAAKNTEPSRAGTMRIDPRFVPPPAVRRDVNAAPRMMGTDIPRFVMSERWRLREMVITYVIDRTPRRHGTAGRINHDNHNVAAARTIETEERMSLWDYHRRGGLRNHLTWDVDHGYVRVVNRAAAPIIQEPVPPVPEVETEPAAPVFERPATDTTPTTLDGLMELIEADQSERTFFAERQMELNA